MKKETAILVTKQGEELIIDKHNQERVSKFKWSRRKNGAVVTTIHGKVIALPTFILKKYGSGQIEKNEDFTEENLTKNPIRHVPGFKDKTSDFKGVYQMNGYWHAEINLQGRNKKIGEFKTEADAARAYNVHARRHFGEDCYLNDVPDKK